jgi:putative exosortase-associated protein (TIGR04073 family)
MRRANSLCLCVIVLATLCLHSSAVYAQDPIHKVGRGLANVLACWIEVPKNLHLGTQEENPILGTGWGLIKGSGFAVTRLVVGAYEAATFLIPYPRDYASPYDGMELEDYPWQ